jgi:hypothetical protein
MDPFVIAAMDAIQEVPALKKRYRELFGEESKSSNKQFLFRRIAWRLQANAEGDLSGRARRRAAEIADDRDLRIRAPKEFVDRQDSVSGNVDCTRLPKAQDLRIWLLRAVASELTGRELPHPNKVLTKPRVSDLCLLRRAKETQFEGRGPGSVAKTLWRISLKLRMRTNHRITAVPNPRLLPQPFATHGQDRSLPRRFCRRSSRDRMQQ